MAKFAKLYDTDGGQILVTRISYGNGFGITIQFNDVDDEDENGIHNFEMMFSSDEEGARKSQEAFEQFTESSAMMLIMKAVANAKIGITKGNIEELSDLMSTRH